MTRSNHTRAERAASAFAIKFGTDVLRHNGMPRTHRVSITNLNIGSRVSYSPGYSYGALVIAYVVCKGRVVLGTVLSFQLVGDRGRWIGGTCKVRLWDRPGEMFFTAELNKDGELVVKRT